MDKHVNKECLLLYMIIETVYLRKFLYAYYVYPRNCIF